MKPISNAKQASVSTLFMSVRILLLAFSALLLTSCVSSPSPVLNDSDVSTAPDEPTELIAADAPLRPEVSEPEPVEIEYGQIPEDVLSRSILAELALQRGHNEDALEYYLELARETNNLSIIQRATRLAGYLRDFSASIELSELWLEQEPESIEARRMFVVQLLFSGRYRQAMDQMVLLQEAGEEVNFLMLPSQAVNDSSAPLLVDALISDYETLQVRFPENQSIRLGLALLYERNDQVQEAYDVISQLTAESDDDPELVMQEIQLLEKLGETKQAERRLTDSLRDNPENQRLRFMYGRKLIDEREFQAAKQQFTILVDQNPEDYDMLYSLALLCMEVNMLEEARGYWQKLVLSGQRLDDAHFYLGYINVQEDKPQAAIEQYLLVKGGNNFLVALRNLSELMVQDGRHQEMHAHLQNTRFRNAEYNIPLLSMEANILIDNELYAEASELLNSAVGAFPNNIQLLFQRSVLHQELNNLAEMEQDLRRVILLDPSSPVAYNSLGYTLADRTDRFEDAYALIARAVELAPNDPAIIDSLGWVQYKLGQLEAAKQNLERAYELFPDPEVAAHLGEVLWVLGEKNAARDVWDKALQVEPDSEFILEARERLNSNSTR